MTTIYSMLQELLGSFSLIGFAAVTLLLVLLLLSGALAPLALWIEELTAARRRE